MILYLFKFSLCSSLLLMLYYWVLEKEKMLIFNRFYLLFSILFSALVPLSTFQFSLFSQTSNSLITENNHNFDPPIFAEITYFSPSILPSQNIERTDLWWVLYGAISLLFFIRLVKNLYFFWLNIRKNDITQNNQLKFILLPQDTIPYSFGSYVFVSKNQFENGVIESEILVHEEAHIRQRHSFDILFVELMLAIAWWNPALWLYRKAIMLNHEFLADDWVIKKSANVAGYQQLLLHKITQNNRVRFASSFNYLITKKRFTMMTKITSALRIYALQVVAATLFIALLFIFGETSIAQNEPKITTKTIVSTDFTKEGVSQVMLDEYKQIVEKYLTRGERNGKEWNRLDRPSETDRARLETIFRTMSKEQQFQQKYAMNPPLAPLPRTTPTKKEYEAYKNPTVYGVWIDEKKVPNTALEKYKATDFSQVFVSKLYKNAQATIGYKYKFQLNLMTTAYYEKYRAENLADKKYWLGGNVEKFRQEKANKGK